MADAVDGTGAGGAEHAAARTLRDDAARTRAAHRLLTSGDDRGVLQTIVGLAVQLTGAPSAEISLLTDERVLIAAVDAIPGPAGSRTALEDALCTRAAAAGERLVIDDAVTDPRSRDFAAVLRGELGAYLAVPVVGDSGSVVGALCVYGPGPRTWSPAHVETLEHLAAAAAAQLEIAALDREYGRTDRDELLAEAVRAAAVGTFRWDLATGDLVWDEALLEAFGYDEAEFGGTIEAFDARVHPEDLARVAVALDEAIATLGIYEAEFRVLRPDGTVRWLSARGRALPGADGTAALLVGVTNDTTALRVGEEHVREVLEGMSVAYFRLDEDWRFTYVNAEAERVLGRPRQELLGGSIWTLFPAAVGTEFETGYRAVARTGDTVVFDAYYPAPLDAWYEVRAVPEHGGVAAYFTDVTQRRRALETVQVAEHKAALLARVAAELAEAQDPAEALVAVLPHLVPDLADFAIASLLHEGAGHWRQRLEDVAGRHGDPARQEVLDAYLAERVPALTGTSPVAEALTTGRPAVAVAAGTSAPGALLADGPALTLLRRLAPHATVVLPVRGRGRTRGLLTLVNGAERGEFSAADLQTLQEAVGQMGLALDNAHLHATRRHLAEELQQSLLTRLPEPDHLQLAARYLPAATGAQVGGDWYDAFLVRDGSTCLVIGDVTGHDLRAAVAMAQVRNVLRGGAHAVVDPPAAILRSLDWAMQDLGIEVLSSGVLAKVEPPDAVAPDGRRLLRWSNAGHLPPLLLRPDGRAELLVRPADTLLGLRAHNERHDHTVVLEPGSTVLLYTDGLVERRGEPLPDALERLRTAVEDLAGLGLDALCDRLVAELAHDSGDDVALLAVRAVPEDGSRDAPAPDA